MRSFRKLLGYIQKEKSVRAAGLRAQRCAAHMPGAEGPNENLLTREDNPYRRKLLKCGKGRRKTIHINAASSVFMD